MGSLRAEALQVRCAGDLGFFELVWKVVFVYLFVVFTYVLDFYYLFKYWIPSICLRIGFLVFAIFAAAYPSVLYKKNQKVVNHYQMNAVCQIITGVVMLSLSYFIGEETHAINWNQELIIATVYLIIMGGVISWGIYFWLYQHLTVTQVTYVAIFPPIVAIIIGYLFLNDQFQPHEIIGTILILGGSVLIYRK